MTAPVTYTREQMEAQAELIEHGGWTLPAQDRTAAMLRQAAAERDRLAQVVQSHVEAYKSAHDRAQQAEAEVTRLTAAMLRQAAAGPKRCVTCRHFGRDEGGDTPFGFAVPFGVCRMGAMKFVPADGTGFCYLHKEAK